MRRARLRPCLVLLAFVPLIGRAKTVELRFDPDRGQRHGQADFMVRGAGYGLWLEPHVRWMMGNPQPFPVPVLGDMVDETQRNPPVWM